jgi:hypothetical protein
MKLAFEMSKAEHKEQVFPEVSETQGLCRLAITTLSMETDTIAEPLQNQCSTLEDAIDRLNRERIRLCTELEGWKDRITGVVEFTKYQKSYLTLSKAHLLPLNATLALVRILPTEVLIKIFEEYTLLCWNDNNPLPADSWTPKPEIERTGSSISIYSCLILTHVCHRWRDIAWSVSRLWTHIGGYSCFWWPDSQISFFRQLTNACGTEEMHIIVSQPIPVKWEGKIPRKFGISRPDIYAPLRKALVSCLPSFNLDITGIYYYYPSIWYSFVNGLTALSLVFVEDGGIGVDIEQSHFPQVKTLKLTLPNLKSPCRLRVKKMLPWSRAAVLDS